MKKLILIILFIFCLIPSSFSYENPKLAEKIDNIVVTLLKTEEGTKKLNTVLNRVTLIASELQNGKLKTMSGKNVFIIQTLLNSIIKRSEEKKQEILINENTYESKGLPINLLNNHKYHIKITGEGGDVTNGDIPIFDIKKNKNGINIIKYYKDLDTGKIKKTYDYNEYKLYYRAKTKFNRSTLNFDKIGTNYTIEECHYVYEYIREDRTCKTYILPLKVEQGQVEGYYYNYEEYSNYNKKRPYKYNIEVLGKEKTEKECNIKGLTKDGIEIYYTKDSKNYFGLNYFNCFIDKKEAEKKGYKLNYSEENNLGN